METWLAVQREGIARFFALLADLPAEYAGLIERAAAASGRDGAPLGLVYAAAFLLVGWGIERLFWRASRQLREHVVARPQVTVGDRIALFLIRLLFSVAQLAVFAIGSIGLFLLLDWPDLTKIFVLHVMAGFVMYRAAAILSRMVVAPWVDHFRLVRLDRDTAVFVDRWIKVLALVAAFGTMMAAMFARLGAPRVALLVETVVVILLAIAMVVCLVNLVRRRRAAVLAARSSLGALGLPILAILATPVVAVLWLTGAQAMAATIMLAAATLLLVPVISQVTESLLAPALVAGQPVPERHAYAAPIGRAMRVLVVAAGLAWIADLWGVPLFSASAVIQHKAAQAAFTVVMTALLADMVWSFASTAVDRLVADEAMSEGDQAAHRRRLRTLLPLFRSFLGITLLTMVVLVGLSSLGIDIGPLLAGAGVAGLAIGFGAQALVRDIVSGVFFLIDDAFRVGEYVEVDRLKGTVEHISIRSLILRHHRGPVHTVPFGQIKSLTNHSRDWAIMKLEFVMAYDTDPEKFKKVVKKVGAEVAADAELGPHIIDAPKSQGVTQLGDYGLVMRVKFTAKPGEQFTVRKLLYHKLLAAFAANNLRLATREVVVRGDGAGEAAAATAAMPARADAVE